MSSSERKFRKSFSSITYPGDIEAPSPTPMIPVILLLAYSGDVLIFFIYAGILC